MSVELNMILYHHMTDRRLECLEVKGLRRSTDNVISVIPIKTEVHDGRWCKLTWKSRENPSGQGGNLPTRSPGNHTASNIQPLDNPTSADHHSQTRRKDIGCMPDGTAMTVCAATAAKVSNSHFVNGSCTPPLVISIMEESGVYPKRNLKPERK
ncbi:hypothetical protein ARMGADRAFT_1040296 [Armillaria gallica]|uniref:Uncharacterized protein n=1 Tax=Armillaria gallica TaxID=47427 RepID=A0A2H3CVH2_ARMGA|nr:hypothetical protein ARMGADRAFT_1040296 [Armillaria gallica]